MIFLQVKGGLGNQLFQYSVAYYLKKQTGSDLCLDYSNAKVGKVLKTVGYKKKFSFRDARLECFLLDSHTTQDSVMSFLVDRMTNILFNQKGFTGKSIARLVTEEGSNCRDNHVNILRTIDRNNDVILSGYWQNIHYIDPIKDDLIRQFKMSLKTGKEYDDALEQIQSCESIGVHVRRGDFVILGWDKGADYYLNAISAAKKTIPGAKFFFFSDDQDWVQKNLVTDEDNVQIAINEEFADVKEFNLLKCCKHQIISESTFGWWAAFLNQNKQKKIFVPFNVRGDIWNAEWERIVYGQ